jgi:hypothetical protein
MTVWNTYNHQITKKTIKEIVTCQDNIVTTKYKTIISRNKFLSLEVTIIH